MPLTPHQIGHAFDDAGSQYDASGALRDWWTPADRSQYQAKAQCFANQYSQLTVNVGNGQSGHVDGRNTLGENIADNTGIVQTLRAFLKYAPEPALPWFPFGCDRNEMQQKLSQYLWRQYRFKAPYELVGWPLLSHLNHTLRKNESPLPVVRLPSSHSFLYRRGYPIQGEPAGTRSSNPGDAVHLGAAVLHRLRPLVVWVAVAAGQSDAAA